MLVVPPSILSHSISLAHADRASSLDPQLQRCLGGDDDDASTGVYGRSTSATSPQHTLNLRTFLILTHVHHSNTLYNVRATHSLAFINDYLISSPYFNSSSQGPSSRVPGVATVSDIIEKNVHARAPIRTPAVRRFDSGMRAYVLPY